MARSSSTDNPFSFDGPWPDNSRHPEATPRGSSMGPGPGQGGTFGGGANEG